MSPNVLEVPGGLEATADHFSMHPSATEMAPAKTVSRVPFSMPSEQSYYWSYRWQEAELAALADLDAGQFVDFDGTDANAAVRWLTDGQ